MKNQIDLLFFFFNITQIDINLNVCNKSLNLFILIKRLLEEADYKWTCVLFFLQLNLD